MSNLVDIETQPVIDVWGERRAGPQGSTASGSTLSVVELAPDAVVPGHRHENEQLGMVITGSITFTIGDERRELGPGGTWRIPSDTPHQASVGPAGAVVIDIFAPVRDRLGRPADRAAVAAGLADPRLTAVRGARPGRDRGRFSSAREDNATKLARPRGPRP